MPDNMIVTVILVFILGIVLGCGIFWFYMKRKGKTGNATVSPSVESQTIPPLAFHWNQLIIPISIFVICLIMAIYFGPSIPDRVAFRFNTNGIPTSYMSKFWFLGIMIGSQFLILMAALILSFVLIKLGQRLFKNAAVTMYPQKAIWLMINMLALPQIILAYIMLDVSFYALHESHIMLPWLFTMIAVVVGSIVLIILFIQAINQSRKIVS
jgi:uncharacterized membrane protein